jgi:hypothetical protein
MLKIKDNIPLTELEKFGFEEFNCGFESCFVFPKGIYKMYDQVQADKDCIIVNGSCIGANKGQREIVCTFSNMNYFTFEDVASRPQFNVLYDLIKADVVEKVEN